MQESNLLVYWVISLFTAAKHHLGGSRGSQLCGLTGPAPISRLVKAFIRFSYVVDWPSPWPIFQPLFGSDNTVQQNRHFVGMRKTCPEYVNLFTSKVPYKKWNPRFWRLTPELSRKPSQHILPILRRKRRPNTESLCTHSVHNGYVSEPHINSDLTAAA